ncbi:unnamed protein product [Linum trigynum]|uniref:MULE transposase domain-containing protein n=1 Tax=Linum trigynum TaxID=586398 RepID=A0AAV2D4T1_9ROSI
MRWTLIEAQRLGYFIECEFDDQRRVTRLFLCHPESIRMLLAWYFVVLIDSTYKTNKYKQPLVQLIGVSLVKKNFNIGFALIYWGSLGPTSSRQCRWGDTNAIF